MTKTSRGNPSSFRLGPELDAEVDRLADELDIPRSQVVKKAVKLFVARQRHISAVLAEARESYARENMPGGRYTRSVPRDPKTPPGHG